MRHIRLAEIRCFDRKVFSLTFAFFTHLLRLTTLATRVAKETSTTCVQKIVEVTQSDSFWYFENSQSFGMLRHAYCLTLKM